MQINTPIANQVVNIRIIDASGGENHQQVTTDESGNGMLQLNSLTVGNYSMVVVYGGNDNYSNCNTSQSLEIKVIKVEPKVEQNTVEQSTAEPYVVSMSDDGGVLYWSDGHTSYRGETGNPITKEQYEELKTYGKR